MSTETLTQHVYLCNFLFRKSHSIYHKTFNIFYHGLSPPQAKPINATQLSNIEMTKSYFFPAILPSVNNINPTRLACNCTSLNVHRVELALSGYLVNNTCFFNWIYDSLDLTLLTYQKVLFKNPLVFFLHFILTVLKLFLISF